MGLFKAKLQHYFFIGGERKSLLLLCRKAFVKMLKGGIFALLFVILTPLRLLFPKKIDNTNLRKILAIRMGAMGDIIHTTPAFRAIKQHYPDCELIILAEKRYADIICTNPNADRFFFCEFPSLLKKFRKLSEIRKLFHLISEIRAEKFDVVVNFHTGSSPAIVTFLSKAKYRVGFAHGISRIFYDKAVRIPSSVRHYVDKCNLLTEVLGVSIQDKRLDLVLDDGDILFAEHFLGLHNLPKESFLIGIHPGGGNPYRSGDFKRWNEKGFASVANELVKKYNARVILFGSLAELSIVKKLQSLLDFDAIDAAGKTTVRQLATLIKKCSLLICNDSAPKHIAVAMGIPTISVWGSVDPCELGAPVDMAIHRVVQSPLSCSPCGAIARCPLAKKKQRFQCIREISPEAVVNEAIVLLNYIQSSR